jgi:hypothetical protein
MTHHALVNLGGLVIIADGAEVVRGRHAVKLHVPLLHYHLPARAIISLLEDLQDQSISSALCRRKASSCTACNWSVQM